MELSLESRCIHGNKYIGCENRFESEKWDGPKTREELYGSVTTPIFLSATYSHPGVGESTGYNYSRHSNPTRNELERVMSSLEGAYDSIACSSGMAAISLVLELFGAGDHFVCTEDLYGGSVRIFDVTGRPRGLSFSYVDTSDPSKIEAAITDNTKAIYVETPSNPTMLVTDLRKCKEIADAHGLLLIVDNTFLSPYLLNPISLGADIVVHSGTKFLGGHNDALAGFVCVTDPERAERLRFLYKSIGACLSPFDSYLILRGIKTLAVRMERQQENALAIAKFLKTQSKVKHVYYVGLPEDPGYETNRAQARGAGSMISFAVDSEQTAHRVLEKVRLIAFAESLGGPETLITYPCMQTHPDVPVEVRERLGITTSLLRLSTGLENAADLIADLEQALS